MKKLHAYLLGLLFLFVLSQSANAQQANIWYFGDHAGVDFTGGSPTPISTGAIYTNEGCASICDGGGNLLFYTDGINIWDNTHTVINPGTPLYGNSSSSQSAVIIPKPGSANRFYIFTQDEHGLSTCTYGLNYSEVDVTSYIVTLITANTNLESCSQTTEKITAACHSNGTDYWAVTVNQNGDFVSWPVTSAGVGAAVTSAGMAAATTGTDDMVGYMKISHQGTHLALARRQYNSVNELFTFSNSTGVVTSNLGTYYTGTAYGVEFSSNGQYFYVSQGFYDIVQYQVASLSTFTTLHSSSSEGALQIGPDGKIYVATGYENSNSDYLHQIDNINTYPATFNTNYVTLSPGTHVRLGLPDVVNCFVPHEDCKVTAKFGYVYDTDRCAYDFTDVSTIGTGTTVVAWEWTFGDGFSSTEQNPSHRYSAVGVYNVCLTVYAMKDGKCCSDKYCTDIQVPFVCDKPCDIQPEFEWKNGECDPCNYHFWAYTLAANTDILGWIWDFGDGTSGTGQVIDHVFPGPGLYNVCLTIFGRPDKNGQCCVFKLCYPVQVDCKQQVNSNANPSSKTGPAQGNTTAPASNDLGLKAFPNPANNNLRVEFNAPAGGKIKFQLFDYTGKLQWEGTELNAAKGRMGKNIDISALSSGLYLLVIEGENLKVTEKIQVIKN